MFYISPPRQKAKPSDYLISALLLLRNYNARHDNRGLGSRSSDVFPSSQRRARSASPIGRSLKRSCAERSEVADGVVRSADHVFAEPTTPALRASPPLRGGECRQSLHHFSKLLLSTFNVSRLRNIAITRASPTAASAEATTSTKKTNIWPLIWRC